MKKTIGKKMPKSEQPPIQEPATPEGKLGSLEEVGPKTREQQEALSRAVSAALEEAARENADLKAGRTSTPTDILREVVDETRAKNKRVGNVPLNTGSSIQMAFKEAIDPEKARLEKNEGVLIGVPGNPKTQKDVLDNLAQMGKISRDGEGQGERTEVLRRWPFTKTSPRNKNVAENIPPLPKHKAGKTAGETPVHQTEHTEAGTDGLVVEKQKLIKLGKDRRTPENNKRLQEIEVILRKPAREKPEKDKTVVTPPAKPHLSPAETKKFLEEQRLKKKAEPNQPPDKTKSTARPTGDWEKKRLSTVGRVIKKLEKKGDKISPEEKRDLERLAEDREKLLSGWKREDFEMLAYKRRLEKPADPVRKEHLEETLKELTDSKFTAEQLAGFARNKAELDAKNGESKAVAKFKGNLTLQDKLEENDPSWEKASEEGSQPPSEAYEDDYLPRKSGWVEEIDGKEAPKKSESIVLTPEEWERSEQVKKEKKEKAILYEQDLIEKNTPKSTIYTGGEKGEKEIREPISPAEKEHLAKINQETRSRAMGNGDPLVKDFLKENYESNYLEYFDKPEKAPSPEVTILLKKAREIMASNLNEAFGGFFGTVGGERSEIWRRWNDRKVSTVLGKNKNTPEEVRIRTFLEKLSARSQTAAMENEVIGQYTKMACVEIARYENNKK